MSYTPINIEQSATVNAQNANGNFQNLDQRIGAVENGGGTSKHINIMVLGNSYSLNSFSYLPFVLKSYGITSTVQIMYYAGAVISQYDKWMVNDDRITRPFINTATMTRWEGNWGGDKLVDAFLHPTERGSCANATETIKWDLIVFQQAPYGFLSNVNTWKLGSLINRIQDLLDYPLMFAWNIGHTANAPDVDKPLQMLSQSKLAYDGYPIDFVFPYGTAIFDGQQNETLSEIGDGGLLRYSDGHLQHGLPQYIAALANAEAIFKRFFPHLSVANSDKPLVGDPWYPTQSVIDAVHAPGNGSSTGIVDGNGNIIERNIRLAQQCAILANKYPWEIKSITEDAS